MLVSQKGNSIQFGKEIPRDGSKCHHLGTRERLRSSGVRFNVPCSVKGGQPATEVHEQHFSTWLAAVAVHNALSDNLFTDAHAGTIRHTLLVVEQSCTRPQLQIVTEIKNRFFCTPTRVDFNFLG